MKIIPPKEAEGILKLTLLLVKLVHEVLKLLRR